MKISLDGIWESDYFLGDEQYFAWTSHGHCLNQMHRDCAGSAGFIMGNKASSAMRGHIPGCDRTFLLENGLCEECPNTAVKYSETQCRTCSKIMPNCHTCQLVDNNDYTKGSVCTECYYPYELSEDRKSCIECLNGFDEESGGYENVLKNRLFCKQSVTNSIIQEKYRFVNGIFTENSYYVRGGSNCRHEKTTKCAML